jgi:hypothetical protein
MLDQAGAAFLLTSAISSGGCYDTRFCHPYSVADSPTSL